MIKNLFFSVRSFLKFIFDTYLMGVFAVIILLGIAVISRIIYYAFH